MVPVVIIPYPARPDTSPWIFLSGSRESQTKQGLVASVYFNGLGFGVFGNRCGSWVLPNDALRFALACMLEITWIC